MFRVNRTSIPDELHTGGKEFVAIVSAVPVAELARVFVAHSVHHVDFLISDISIGSVHRPCALALLALLTKFPLVTQVAKILAQLFLRQEGTHEVCNGGTFALEVHRDGIVFILSMH